MNMKTKILYSPVCITYNEETRAVAGALKSICDELSEAGSIGYYWSPLIDTFVDLFNKTFNTSLSRELIIDKAKRLGVKAERAKLECTRKAVTAATAARKSPIGAERYNKKTGKWLVKVADVPYGHRNWVDKKMQFGKNGMAKYQKACMLFN